MKNKLKTFLIGYAWKDNHKDSKATNGLSLYYRKYKAKNETLAEDKFNKSKFYRKEYSQNDSNLRSIQVL